MALKDIIGQDKAVNILLKTLSRGRVPSAYLFAGEQGIGKKLAALNLAKAVNCEKAGSAVGPQENSDEPLTADYRLFDCCEECLSCRKINAGTHPDLLTAAPVKGEIRIDEIRAVQEALLFMPYEGRRKVVIIDDADMMNHSAANAFLKTLEEPPDKSLLILIAANPSLLPETIISRCCRLNFTPLSYEACKEVVKGRSGQQAGADALAADDPRLDAAIKFSMGRPGFVSSEILDERERAIGLFRNMLRGIDSEIRMERDEMERWFGLALMLVRDMLAVKIAGEYRMRGEAPTGYADCGDVLINADARGWISEIAGKSGIRDMSEVYLKLSALKAYLGYNLNKAVTWNCAASILRGLNTGSAARGKE